MHCDHPAWPILTFLHDYYLIDLIFCWFDDFYVIYVVILTHGFSMFTHSAEPEHGKSLCGLIPPSFTYFFFLTHELHRLVSTTYSLIFFFFCVCFFGTHRFSFVFLLFLLLLLLLLLSFFFFFFFN